MQQELNSILCRQADLLAHAGEQLVSAVSGSSTGTAVVRGLAREQRRLKEQAHAAVRAQWSGSRRRPGRPGWLVRNLTCDLLTRPEADSPSARALLLTESLAELGICFEELALTLRLRRDASPFAFTSAVTYSADCVRTIAALVRSATDEGKVYGTTCALFNEYLRRLHEQHWRILAGGENDTTGVALAAARAFATVAGAAHSVAEAVLLYTGRPATADEPPPALPAGAPAPFPLS